MFVAYLLFGMLALVTGDSNETVSICHFNGDIFYMTLDHQLVRLSVIIHVKWVYEIGAKDVIDDAGYLWATD